MQEPRWRTCWPFGTGPTNVSCVSRLSVTIRPLTFTRGQPYQSTAPCQMRHPAARRSRGANLRSYSAFSIGIPHRRRPTGPCSRGRRPGIRLGSILAPPSNMLSDSITNLFRHMYEPGRFLPWGAGAPDFFSRVASNSSRIRFRELRIGHRHTPPSPGEPNAFVSPSPTRRPEECSLPPVGLLPSNGFCLGGAFHDNLRRG
jgi:hypothetical protein